MSGGNTAGRNEQDASRKLSTEDPFDLLVDTTLQLDGSNQQRPPVEAQLELALNLIPAFAWYCNAAGGLTFLNERGSDYLGLPKDHPIRHGLDTGAEQRDLLVEELMELGPLLRFAIGLGAALAQLHARGLIHKEVKPANVLVNPSTGQVWLMGFCISRGGNRPDRSPRSTPWNVRSSELQANRRLTRL